MEILHFPLAIVSSLDHSLNTIESTNSNFIAVRKERRNPSTFVTTDLFPTKPSFYLPNPLLLFPLRPLVYQPRSVN